jgi:uncharacterized membrane protein
MNDTTCKPIVVGSPVSEQLGQAIRTLLTALGGYAVAKGWISHDLLSAIVPVVLILVPLAWGQFRVLKTNSERKVMASALPDSVAVSK